MLNDVKFFETPCILFKRTSVISISCNRIYKSLYKNAKKSAIIAFQSVSLQSTLPNRIHGHCLWRTVLYTMLYNCVT